MGKHDVRRRVDRTHPLKSLEQRDFISLDESGERHLMQRMDLYFDKPLEMFPYHEDDPEGGGVFGAPWLRTKPDRFYAFYERRIDERFPDDADLRDRVHDFSHYYFGALWSFILTKRLLLALTMGAVLGAALWAPTAPVLKGDAGLAAGAAVALSALAVMLYVLLSFGFFELFKLRLTNRAGELSRMMVQRTQDLRKIFIWVQAYPDQLETDHFGDQKAWGGRSQFLMRLLMWLAKRMEYIEAYVQVEMWRIRRARFWAATTGLILTLMLLAAGVAAAWLVPNRWSQASGPIAPGVVTAVFVLLGYLSYQFWNPSMSIVKEKLAPESWVRFGSLELDRVIGNQVRRDKERISEYLALNKPHAYAAPSPRAAAPPPPPPPVDHRPEEVSAD